MIFYLRLPLFSIQPDFVVNSNPKPQFKIFQKYIMCCQQTIVRAMCISCILLFHLFFEGKTWHSSCFSCTTRASTYNRRVWSHKVSSEARSPGERVHTKREKEDHRLKQYQTEIYGYLTSQIIQCGDGVISSKFQDSKSLLNIDVFMMQFRLKTKYETM